VIVHKIHEFTLHMEIIPFLLRYCVFEYSKCLVCEVRFRNLLNVMFILNPVDFGNHSVDFRISVHALVMD
jgi:hypothetical protein